MCIISRIPYYQLPEVLKDHPQLAARADEGIESNGASSSLLGGAVAAPPIL